MAYTERMPEFYQPQQLRNRMDDYLAFHGHSEDSMLQVLKVLDAFDCGIQGILREALGNLETPQHVGATILQFPKRAAPPPESLPPAGAT